MLVYAKCTVRVLVADECEGLAEDLALEALEFGVRGVVKAVGQEELSDPISRGPVVYHLYPIS